MKKWVWKRREGGGGVVRCKKRVEIRDRERLDVAAPKEYGIVERSGST